MPEEQHTDPASPIPMAAPLTGTPAEPDQPEPWEVLPHGDGGELDHVVPGDDRAGA